MKITVRIPATDIQDGFKNLTCEMNDNATINELLKLLALDANNISYDQLLNCLFFVNGSLKDLNEVLKEKDQFHAIYMFAGG